ncbi:MAG: ADP-ribosyl-(dinitrogen reductase) hydrolase [Gammaproteobacteria bacterium]|nr:ADP-ribosyl-(dinitrogen reductase) hydrolase [Gammaproteobacteria bacterium]
MRLEILSRVKEKLAKKKRPVTEEEIVQCFANRTGVYLIDTREEHASDPPTRWFVAETDFGRKLKVVFIPKNGAIIIRTAYDPNSDEIRIFKKHGQPN